jgi:hypothetical protein
MGDLWYYAVVGWFFNDVNAVQVFWKIQDS